MTDMTNIMHEYMPLILLLIGVFCMTSLSVWLVRWLALKYKWVTPPNTERWHKKPTALHGGMGFYPVIAIGIIYIIIYRFSDTNLLYFWIGGKELRLLIALLIGSLIMFILGIIDDFKNYKPYKKLIFQLLAASIFIFSGGVFNLSSVQIIDILISYFWFIGIINAVNMLDNMDGLSSGVVIITSVTLAFLSVSSGEDVFPISIPICLILSASLLSFLQFNKSPASIFMGDSGSLPIGYILSAMAIPSPLNDFLGINRVEQIAGPFLALLLPVVVIAVPIFDTTFVSITRKWRGKSPVQGGKDHSSHRLVLVGMNERQAVWVLYALSILGGLVAILIQRYSHIAYPLVVLYLMILVFVGIYLGHIKVKEIKNNDLPNRWAPIISQLLYKRRVAEVLVDTILIITAYYVAYLIRFDGTMNSETIMVVLDTIPLVVSWSLFCFSVFGVYSIHWNLFSIHDIFCILKAVIFSTFGCVSLVMLLARIEDNFPRINHLFSFPFISISAFIIFCLLLFLFLIGSRFSFRMIDAYLQPNKLDLAIELKKKKALIYGAGMSGKILHQVSLSKLDSWDTLVIGFVDDDEYKSGKRLNGLPIHGKNDWIRKNEVFDELWVASASVSDQLASDFTDQVNRDILVRRFQFGLNPKPTYVSQN